MSRTGAPAKNTDCMQHAVNAYFLLKDGPHLCLSHEEARWL